MAAQTTKHTISAILFQEDGWWTAQCLEYDIATQARTLPELQYELERTIIGHFAVALELGQEPFLGIGQAPKEFWQMFDQAKTRVERPRFPFRLPKLAPLLQPDLRIAELSPA